MVAIFKVELEYISVLGALSSYKTFDPLSKKLWKQILRRSAFNHTKIFSILETLSDLGIDE